MVYPFKVCPIPSLFTLGRVTNFWFFVTYWPSAPLHCQNFQQVNIGFAFMFTKELHIILLLHPDKSN